MSEIRIELNGRKVFESGGDGMPCWPGNPLRVFAFFTPTVGIRWSETDDDFERVYSFALDAPTRLCLMRSDAGLYWSLDLRVLGFGFSAWMQATY